MSKFPAGDRDSHWTFCDTEGWKPPVNAKGKPVGHHVTLELALPDGRILRTRISRPVDRTTYGKSIWGHILEDQLEVTEEQFWACVRDGVLPGRGLPEAPPEALPLALVRQLIKAGLPQDEVAAMTREQAARALADHWMRRTGNP